MRHVVHFCSTVVSESAVSLYIFWQRQVELFFCRAIHFSAFVSLLCRAFRLVTREQREK